MGWGRPLVDVELGSLFVFFDRIAVHVNDDWTILASHVEGYTGCLGSGVDMDLTG